MKKLYNRTALFYARAIVGLFALCLLALPSPALAQAIDLKLTNVTVKEAIEALNQRENYSVAIKSAGVDMQRRVSISAQNASSTRFWPRSSPIRTSPTRLRAKASP